MLPVYEKFPKKRNGKIVMKDGKVVYEEEEVTFGRMGERVYYEYETDEMIDKNGNMWLQFGEDNNTSGIGCLHQYLTHKLKQLDHYERMLNVLLHEDGVDGMHVGDNIEFAKRLKLGSGMTEFISESWKKGWPRFTEDFFSKFDSEIVKEREKRLAEKKRRDEKASKNQFWG